MKKMKKLIFAGAGLLVVALLLVASLWGQNAEVVLASSRMHGVETIVNNISAESPYTILEIVPDKAYSAFGFYVEGQEPGIAPSVLFEANSQTARQELVCTILDLFFNGASDTPFTYDPETVYVEQLMKPDDMTGWQVLTLNSTETRNGRYELALDYGYEQGDYAMGIDANGEVSYTYVPGGGDYIWVDDPSETYPTEVMVGNIYYQVNVHNNNWFAYSVLEMESSENIKVLSLTPREVEEQIQAGTLAWNKVDMIYLSETPLATFMAGSFSQYGEGNDLTPTTAENLLSYIQANSIPTIIDYSVCADGEDNSIPATSEIANIANILKGEMALPSVQKNIFVTNGIVNCNFLTPNMGTTPGADVVKAELESEDFHHQANGNEPIAEWDEETGTYQISQATILKYIMNYGYRRVDLQKEQIHVLDIEPTKYSTLTEEMILSWLGEDVEVDIFIEQTTAAEFIGQSVDLRATYDLIYLGSCVGDGTSNGSMNLVDGKPVYNDSELNGLIYSDIGDTAVINGQTVRYSGNDITKKKLDELNQYVKAGYPVVYASELIMDTVSADSNMAEFLMTNLYKSNVIRDGDNINSDILRSYVNLPKLKIAMVEAPMAYNGDDTSSLVKNDRNDSYELRFTFEFSDLSRAENSGSNYQVQLFIDENGDGRYTDKEETFELEVRDSAGNKIPVDEVKTGERYVVTKFLDESVEGILPWKLAVTLNGNIGPITQASHTGFSYIKPANKTSIKVLQLTVKSDPENPGLDLDANTTFQNLFTQISDKYLIEPTVKTHETFLTEIAVRSNGSAMTKEMIDDYFAGQMDQYDMLILGFADGYADANVGSYANSQFVVDGAIDVIQRYINSGKAVLLTHDTTSVTTTNYWGQQLNECVRKAAGMVLADAETGEEHYSNIYADTYSTSQYKSLVYDNVPQNSTYFVSQVNKGQITSYPFDLNHANDDTRSKEGNYYTITRDASVIGATSSQVYQLNIDYDKNNDGESDVVVWYSLAGMFGDSLGSIVDSVLGALGGYFDQDSWNDISNAVNASDCFSAMPNDVRNNYYIYSIDNVTYTGMGASESTTEFESQLFVNTIVAAYSMGLKSPTVSLLETTEKNSSISKIYRTHDSDVEMYCEDDQYLFFYVVDSNIMSERKTIAVDFYYEVASGQGDMEFNGVQLKKLPFEQLTGDPFEEIIPTEPVDPDLEDGDLEDEDVENPDVENPDGGDADVDEPTDDSTDDPTEEPEEIVDDGLLGWDAGVDNGRVYGISIDADYLKDLFEAFAAVDKHEIKIYVIAESTLEYDITTDPDTGEEKVGYTIISGKGHDIVSIKKRALFNLD